MRKKSRYMPSIAVIAAAIASVFKGDKAQSGSKSHKTGNTVKYPFSSTRQQQRYQRQIANGQLTKSNGLYKGVI